MIDKILEAEHFIIGTAGHIDHGKTALVKALTGVDADILVEEKRRGITIELGFIFMENSGYDRQIVFIDVPGHEKLIKTMVAGASSIDAALLVVAADEGIGLQTQEHFDILQLLGIQRGIIAVTKSDLVNKEHIQDLKAELRDFFKESFLGDAPIIPVSSVNGYGIDELKSALMMMGRSVEKRSDSGIFRMPVDRVFTIHGFGTVIAGTILSGEVRVGDKIEIFPEGISARVRNVQVHHKKTECSIIGRRTAINLPDIKKDKLRRGQCAGLPGSLTPTHRIDGKLRLLKSYGKELKNRVRLRFHTGTAEVICRVVLLDREKLYPGESAFVQFILEAPTIALPRDHFVTRAFSPLMTVGGGIILDSTPHKHKRLDSQTLEGLRRLGGNISETIEQMFIKSGFIPKTALELAIKIGERKDLVDNEIKKLSRADSLVKIASDKEEKYLYKKLFDDLTKKFVSIIENFFKKNPQRLLMPYVNLRSQLLRLTDVQTFKALIDDLCQRKLIYKKDSNIGLMGYAIKMKPREQELYDKVEEVFKEAGFAAPLEEEICGEFGLSPDLFKNIMNSLIDQGNLIRLSKKVIYYRESLESAQELVINYINKHMSITVAELRNELGLSRKYAQAILEYFDSIGITKREGNRHVMK